MNKSLYDEAIHRAEKAESELARLTERVRELEQRNERVVDYAVHTTPSLDELRGCIICERERVRELEKLLQRIYEWDMMDVAADGKYWRSEIDAARRDHE